jgi:uracil-DNA glycosylase
MVSFFMMEKNENIIQQKLYQKFKRSGWDGPLKAFVLSEEFQAIIQFLIDQVLKEKRFTPPLKYLVRAFEECPYDTLQVILLGASPYPQLGIADGLTLSCSLTGKEQPALRIIFDTLQGMQTTTYNRDSDLKRWANQGILLLNASLTCEIKRPDSHKDVWKPFILYLLDILNSRKKGLIFVFVGTETAAFSDSIGNHHHSLFTEHPSVTSSDGGKWHHPSLFQEINLLLLKEKKPIINW